LNCSFLRFTASSPSFERREKRRVTMCLSRGASSVKFGISFARIVVKRIPPKRFFAPGYSPRSSATTESPALAKVRAQAMPDGPAPTIIASNFSSSAKRYPLLKFSLDYYRGFPF